MRIHQNNIVANPLNVMPRHNIIIPAPEQSQMLARTHYDNRDDMPGQLIKLHIIGKPETRAVAYVDDFLAPQIGNPTWFNHNAPPVFSIL